MPRLHALEPNTVTGKAKELLDEFQTMYGMVPNLVRTLANSPVALEAYLSFGRALSGGSLGAELREQIAVAVANANSCQYSASAHTAIGKHLGLDESELKGNLQAFSSDHKVEVALQFARSVINNRGWVRDEEIERLHLAGYGDGEIAEIIATVAMNMFTNYFNHIAQTEVDFPVVDVGEPAKR